MWQFDWASSRRIQGVNGGECPLFEFLWIIVSNITYFTVHLWFIWLASLVTLYVWNLSRMSIILTFLVICKVSLRSSIGAMECLLSMRCCAKLDLAFPYLKSLGNVKMTILYFKFTYRTSMYHVVDSKFKAANKYRYWCKWDPIQLDISCTTCSQPFKVLYSIGLTDGRNDRNW